jgi:hypothetical protein
MKDFAINVLNEDPWKVMPQTYILDVYNKTKSK